MKLILTLLLIFATLKVGCSLKCYFCISGTFANVAQLTCDPKEQLCDPQIYKNGASCITLQYEVEGSRISMDSCYDKLEKPTGYTDMKFDNIEGVTSVRASYTQCEKDLCNGSEGFDVRKRLYSVFIGIFIAIYALYI